MYSPEQIDNSNKLAGFLRCDAQILPILMDKVGADGKEHVRQIKIPKRNYWKLPNPYRIVYQAIDGVLDNTLKVLKFELQKLYVPHDCVFGFVRGKNIVSNAKKHLNKNYIYNIDIKDFFESIDVSKVHDCFIMLGFRPDIASILSRIVTHNGVLVTGFTTSPIIANIICRNMDAALCQLCLDNNIVYTRYADDLTFSGVSIGIQDDIASIVQSFGFAINDSKTKLSRKGQSQYVTGLSISNERYPRISRNAKRKLRQELYYISKFGLNEHTLHIEGNDNDWRLRKKAAHIMGWIHFINSVEPIIAQKCMTIIENLSDDEDVSLFRDANKYIKYKHH